MRLTLLGMVAIVAAVVLIFFITTHDWESAIREK